MNANAQAATRTPTKRAVAFALALALVHAALWLWSIRREGSWAQAPATDASSDLATALVMKRALVESGPRAFARAWMHQSPVHTPLVPAASAALMAVFGESREAAECVLPLATFLLCFSVFRVVERLYGARTAYAATALTTAFPIFLIYSRVYLFEHPLAAMFAATCWAMLRTDGFARWRPTLVFGALAGATSLTRAGAPVFLVGPTLVLAWSARKRGDVARRAARLAAAAALAAAMAATWYAPNFEELKAYVLRATYGEEAALKAGGGSFSLDNFLYYLEWSLAQGPGAWIAAVALACAGVAAVASPARPRLLPATRALLAVYAIDFVLLLLAAQREGARYFQPLMPIVAVCVVRSVAALPWRAARRAAGAAIGALALHHVIALTFAFSVPHQPGEGVVELGDVPLTFHRTYFLGLVEYYSLRTPTDDFKLGEVIDRLATIGLEDGARVGTLSPTHAFFQANGLDYEATKRRHRWFFFWSQPLPLRNEPDALAALDRDAATAEAVCLRTGGVTRLREADLEAGLPALFDPATRAFEQVGEPIELGDGSRVRVFKRAR